MIDGRRDRAVNGGGSYWGQGTTRRIGRGAKGETRGDENTEREALVVNAPEEGDSLYSVVGSPQLGLSSRNGCEIDALAK